MTVGRIYKAVIVEMVDKGVQKTAGAAVQVESDEGAILHRGSGSPVTSQLPAYEASMILDVIALGLGHGRVFRYSFRRPDGRGKLLAELVWRETLRPPVLLEAREAG